MADGSPARRRLLVTGATGLLGAAVVREAGRAYEVYGLARRPTVVPLPCRPVAVDLADVDATRDAIDRIAPDVVIHTAALASVDQCQQDPQQAALMNVTATSNLIAALRGSACQLVFISSDSVFDGTRGDYDEYDEPAPINVYSRTKVDAERLILASGLDAVIARTAFYGWNVLPKLDLAEWILSTLRDKGVIRGFFDAQFSPLATTHLAGLLLHLVTLHARGILNVASSEPCSKYQFARQLAARAGFSPDQVQPIDMNAAGLIAPRPKNVTLVTRRAEVLLGRRLPNITEGLDDFFDTAAVGHCRWLGSVTRAR